MANGLGVLIANFESPDVATQLTCPAMYDGLEEANNCATPNTVLLTSQVEDTESCAQSVSHSPEAVPETQNVGSDELQCSNLPVVKVPVPNASLLAEDNLCEVPITVMETIAMVKGKATTVNTRNPVKRRGRPKKNPDKLQVSDSFLLDKEPNEIAKLVWHLGLQLGVSGVIDETTAKLTEMESRDRKAVGRSTRS
ncbi:polyprotein [Sesbania bispinosa]|nr:polyprotein [Sesbania bispinosa]